MKRGFTIIEILVVTLIIVALMSLIIPQFSGIRDRALKGICQKNIKNLTQTICVYTSLSEGYLKNFTQASPVENIYGAMFQEKEWNDLNNLVCPASKKSPPEPNGYGCPLVVGAASTIDYWIVFAGNEHDGELNTLFSPPGNVLIIERFSGNPGGWLDSDNHKTGGSVGKVNGTAKFMNTFPVNETAGGSTENITKSKCAT